MGTVLLVGRDRFRKSGFVRPLSGSELWKATVSCVPKTAITAFRLRPVSQTQALPTGMLRR